MNTKSVKEFVTARKGLFWWIRKGAPVPPGLLVEQVLNYGNDEDVRALFALMGEERVARIFFRQTARARHNYSPVMKNFFTLYFRRHASRDSHSREQRALLPLVKSFAGSYYLAGGTAIALQIGHRRSIDFDLFTRAAVKPRAVQAAVQRYTGRIPEVIHAEYGQLHLLVKGVKFTFMTFPFDVPASMRFEAIIAMPSLPVLGAMKAFAFGGRAKWKDYVDMYFLLKYFVSLDEIITQARQLFGSAFNAKLFRGQLAYFKDIDYREAIDYVDTPVADSTIKRFLARTASAAI